MRIIYPLNGGIAVVIPTGEISINEVAKKDVPSGLPYLFVEESDLPSDRYFRDAWEADFSNPDGYGIGHDAWEYSNKKAREDTQREQESKNSKPPIMLGSVAKTVSI